MKNFTHLNKTEIWLKQVSEEIRSNIKNLTRKLEVYYFKDDHNKINNGMATYR